MLLEEFRHIAETAMPQPIQSRMVTPDEARAVLTSFGRLSDDKLRTNFLGMPVDNIIEFSLTQAKKRPMLYNYMNGHAIKEATEEPPATIPATELDHLDQPPAPKLPEPPPAPVVEKAKPKRQKPLREAKPHPAESYFTRLTERLEQLAVPQQPPSIVVETAERHVERLAEIEQSMLGTMDVLVERIGRYATQSANTNDDLRETLAMQREMIQQISQSQVLLNEVQTKLVVSQAQIVDTITQLAEKVALFAQTPPVVNPVVNVPAPVVNVSVPEGRKTKVVERDGNNLISRITESYD